MVKVERKKLNFIVFFFFLANKHEKRLLLNKIIVITSNIDWRLEDIALITNCLYGKSQSVRKI